MDMSLTEILHELQYKEFCKFVKENKLDADENQLNEFVIRWKNLKRFGLFDGTKRYNKSQNKRLSKIVFETKLYLSSSQKLNSV